MIQSSKGCPRESAQGAPRVQPSLVPLLSLCLLVLPSGTSNSLVLLLLSFGLLEFLSSVQDDRAFPFSPGCARDKPARSEFLCQVVRCECIGFCLPVSSPWRCALELRSWQQGKVSVKSNRDKRLLMRQTHN